LISFLQIEQLENIALSLHTNKKEKVLKIQQNKPIKKRVLLENISGSDY